MTKEEANAQQNFGKAAQQAAIGCTVAKPVGKGEERHEHKERHQQPNGRSDQFTLLTDDQLEEPDKEQLRAQRHVEQGGFEADVHRQAGKGKHEGDARKRNKDHVVVGKDERPAH